MNSDELQRQIDLTIKETDSRKKLFLTFLKIDKMIILYTQIINITYTTTKLIIFYNGYEKQLTFWIKVVIV